MGKFRVRVNRKGALDLKPGQSSSSNAPVTKFRDEARSQRLANQAPLVAVDEQMEQATSEDVTDQIGLEDMNIDESSAGAKTVISRYTNCTNPTFNPINRVWNDDDVEKQQDVLNLLAFAADTIRERQGGQSDVEYYGVLLAALDDIPVEDVKKIYANSYLLHLLFPKIPKELLIKHFDRVKPILDRKLQALATDKNAYGAIKFLLSSLGSLLKAQPQAFWNVTEHKATLSDLVAFASHPHPGVRMISRRTIRALLTEEPHVTPNGVHPGAKTVAKAVKEHLDTANGNKDTITRLLCLLEGILHRMPDTTLASLLEYLLQLGSSGDTTVRCSAYQCIQRTLEKPPSVDSLPINRNAELIIALRSQQIPTDVSVFAYWLQALTEAHCCLSLKTPEKSVNLLPDTLELFGKAFQVPNADLGYAVHLSLNRLMSDCIKDNSQASQKCLDVLERSFNVQNTDVWKHIFSSMSTMIEHAGKAIDSNVFIKVLQTLAAMREKDDCICPKDIDNVIASAIKHVGMAKVMGIIELGLNPTAPELPTDFTRSWMLPLLIHNVRNENISFFTSTVIPVLVSLHERLPKLTEMNAKLYHALELQIWEILPHLLESPADFPDSFPILAPMIGSALAQRLDLRIVLLKALRCALRFAERHGYTEVVKKYAKNYLPILFNIYTVSPAETMDIVKSQSVRNYDDRAVRLSTLETVRSYIVNTPDEVRNNFTATALTKLTSDDAKMTMEKKQAITDLVIALVRGMDAEQFAEVFSVIQDWFTSGLGSFQKKAYRVLSEMYKRINEPQLRPFFEKNAPFVQDLIAKGFEGVQKPSRGPRIGVYRSILTTFKEYDELKHFVNSILEQVILSQDKSFSKTTREQAAHCFLQICDRLIDFGSDADVTPSAALEPILAAITQLYNEPVSGNEEVSLEQARSALISLNMITQKYVKFLNPTVLDKLINIICATLYDLRNPIKMLAVRCMRILCNKLQQFAMSQYKDSLLKHIFEQDFTVHSLKVRKANRLLLEVLVDRYGHELLVNATDKDDFVKQIKHIAKMKRRKERRAAGMQSEEDEGDDEIQSTFTTANTVKADTIFDILEDSDEEGDEEKIKSFDNKSTLLNEDEDEVVDLLDRDTYIQKLSAVDSRIKKKVTIEAPKKDETFRVDKQGRIMIVNIDKKRKRYNSEMFEDDEEVEAKSVEDEVAEEQKEDIHSVVASTYKPGGRGIHRQTAHSEAMSYVSNATTTNGKAKKSDHKKKEDKFEPYAYIPLRNKGRSNGLKSILKKKGNKGRKGRKS